MQTDAPLTPTPATSFLPSAFNRGLSAPPLIPYLGSKKAPSQGGMASNWGKVKSKGEAQGTAGLEVRPHWLEARVPAGMRKLLRAPRPGEKSRNLDDRLSQKARAAPARKRPRLVPRAPDLSHATSRAPHHGCGRAPAAARVRKHRELISARSLHPRGQGRGRGSEPALGGGKAPRAHLLGCRVSWVPPPPSSARPALETPRPGPPTPGAAHSPGLCSSSGCPRGTWLATPAPPSVRSTQHTFLYCVRAAIG